MDDVEKLARDAAEASVPTMEGVPGIMREAFIEVAVKAATVAILAERERCGRVAEDAHWTMTKPAIAAAIRNP